MRKTLASILVGILVSWWVTATPSAQADDLTVRLAVTDLEGLEQLQREFGTFRDLLSEKTGLAIKFYSVPNRTAAVEAVLSKKLEFVLTGPAEYVIFKSRTDAIPIAGFSRPDYFADIVTLADSGIQSVADLRGKKVALGSVGSTSKHLAPMQILRDGGLTPSTDVEVLHIDSLKMAWEALKRGDVQALGTTNDKFLKLRETETDVPPGAFRVIARSRDLPNDILLARPDLDPTLIQKVQAALQTSSDELIAAILKGDDNQKYAGMKFLTTIQDSDYDYIRAMYRTAGYHQFAKFIDE